MKKCEREIKALLNTLSHLQVRNKNYVDKFKLGAEGADLERKQILDDQYRTATENFFRKQRELQQLNTNFDTAQKELDEVKREREQFQREGNTVGSLIGQLNQVIQQSSQQK